MNTPIKRSRKRKVSLDNDDFKEIIYTEEEAEMLGFNIPKSEEPEEDEDEEDVEEIVAAPKISRNEVFHKKKPTDKAKFYVNPDEFTQEIRNYYDTDHMSDNLALMISKISNKLSFAPNFINYSWREELVGDGIIRMFKALMGKKYDFVKGGLASSGPFSYFSRVAFNAFRNRIKKEKHMQAVHEKYQQELLLFSENHNMIMKNNQMRIQKQNRE